MSTTLRLFYQAGPPYGKARQYSIMLGSKRLKKRTGFGPHYVPNSCEFPKDYGGMSGVLNVHLKSIGAKGIRKESDDRGDSQENRGSDPQSAMAQRLLGALAPSMRLRLLRKSIPVA